MKKLIIIFLIILSGCTGAYYSNNTADSLVIAKLSNLKDTTLYKTVVKDSITYIDSIVYDIDTVSDIVILTDTFQVTVYDTLTVHLDTLLEQADNIADIWVIYDTITLYRYDTLFDSWDSQQQLIIELDGNIYNLLIDSLARFGDTISIYGSEVKEEVNTGYLYHQDFQDTPTDQYTTSQFNEDFNNPSWRNDKLPSITEQKDLQVTFPENSFGWIKEGAMEDNMHQWPISFEGRSKVTLEYDVYFDEDFGIHYYAGKLPGLAANGVPGGGYLPDDEASFRYMFHGEENGTVRIGFYMYYPGMYNTDYYNDSEPVEEKNYYGHNLTLGNIETGKWYTIKQVVDLGTPSSNYSGGNGTVKGYINEELKANKTGLWLRKYDYVNLDRIFFSVFTGGSGEIVKNECNIYFDNFKVY